MEYKKLGDIATYINGYAFKPEQRGSEGLPIIRIQDLTGNAYDLGYYNGDYPNKIELNDGDVLISWSASLGVYLWNRGKALLNQHIFKVVFDKVEIDKFYFMYAVEYNLDKMSLKTHGDTMKHITKKDFDNVVIPYPDLDYQKEISYRLTSLKGIIKKYQKQLDLLDELIKARFVEMFGDPVTNDMLWNTDVLKDICTKIGSGSTPRGGKESYIDEGISLIRSMNVHNAYFEYKDLAHITLDQAEKLNNVVVEHDDLLFNITGASVARCCVVPSDVLPARVNQHVCILRCREKINPIFLQGLLVNENYQGKLLQIAKSGATREAINKQQLESLEIMIPTLELQNQFSSFVEEIDKSRSRIQKSLEASQELFDSLMQEYFG